MTVAPFRCSAIATAGSGIRQATKKAPRDVGRVPIDVDRAEVDPLDDRVPEVAADSAAGPRQLRGALDLDHEDGHAASCSTAKLTVRFAASAATSRARTRVPGSGQPPSTRRPDRGIDELNRVVIDDQRREPLALAAAQDQRLDEVDDAALDRPGAPVPLLHQLRQRRPARARTQPGGSAPAAAAMQHSET